MITGYYEPMLKGSRTKSSQYPYPLYRQPNDLVTVELGDVYPELKNKRVRGKLVGNKQEGQKIVPYLTRAEIESMPAPLAGSELLWINDIIDGFFLQIQGSGLVKLDSGENVHVGYANQNGQTYNSIGRLLVDRGELTLDQASMLGIKNWASNNMAKLRDLLNSNPSYVFFRELPAGLSGPLGALGVPISAERSVAIDPKFIPLGAPLFLSTTQPNSAIPLKRLMVAQDTGGAIKGGVRADLFWGAGDIAGKQAGAMKQVGKIWVLLPKDFQFP
jgi:membrane-bound lytic murein transglycosylase A